MRIPLGFEGEHAITIRSEYGPGKDYVFQQHFGHEDLDDSEQIIVKYIGVSVKFVDLARCAFVELPNAALREPVNTQVVLDDLILKKIAKVQTSDE